MTNSSTGIKRNGQLKKPVLSEVVHGFYVIHVRVGPVDPLRDDVHSDAHRRRYFVLDQHDASRSVHVRALYLGRKTCVAWISKVREKHVSVMKSMKILSTNGQFGLCRRSFSATSILFTILFPWCWSTLWTTCDFGFRQCQKTWR